MIEHTACFYRTTFPMTFFFRLSLPHALSRSAHESQKAANSRREREKELFLAALLTPSRQECTRRRPRPFVRFQVLSSQLPPFLLPRGPAHPGNSLELVSKVGVGTT